MSNSRSRSLWAGEEQKTARRALPLRGLRAIYCERGWAEGHFDRKAGRKLKGDWDGAARKSSRCWDTRVYLEWHRDCRAELGASQEFCRTAGLGGISWRGWPEQITEKPQSEDV